MAIQIDSLYRIDLPDNLRPGYDMHDYASLQYYDAASQFYVIGLEDSKENLGDIKRKQLKIQGYFDHLERSAFERADSSLRTDEFRYLNHYGIRVRCGDYWVSGKAFGEVELYYRLCMCESPNYFYQMVIWMPFEYQCDFQLWVDMIPQTIDFLKKGESFLPEDEPNAGPIVNASE